MGELEEYNEEAWCPKCGCDDVGTYWRAKGAVLGIGHPSGKMYAEFEHMLRICDNCRYSWMELPLDDSDAPEQPSALAPPRLLNSDLEGEY